jgi:hypothetical protein
MRDVRTAPGEEIVHAEDFMAFGQQPLAEMRAEESRAARDQNALALTAQAKPSPGRTLIANVKRFISVRPGLANHGVRLQNNSFQANRAVNQRKF